MTRFSGFLAAAAMGLSLAFTAPALAQGLGANFSIDQTCGNSDQCSEFAGPAGFGTLTGIDRISFTYTARIDQTNDLGGDGPGGNSDVLDGDPFVEKGFAQWQGYANDAGQAVPGQFLNADYQVYMVFTATGTATFVDTGDPDTTGIYVTFDTFVIDIFVSDDLDTALTVPATTAGHVQNQGVDIIPGTDGVLDADDQLIARATLLSVGEAHLFGTLANGDFEIQVTDVGLSLFGPSFFSDPVPFYTVMNFGGNTAAATPPGLIDAPFSSVATGEGQMFFTVPEPGTLGLLGAGLMGAAAFLRRRKSAKAA